MYSHYRSGLAEHYGYRRATTDDAGPYTDELELYRCPTLRRSLWWTIGGALLCWALLIAAIALSAELGSAQANAPVAPVQPAAVSRPTTHAVAMIEIPQGRTHCAAGRSATFHQTVVLRPVCRIVAPPTPRVV